MHWENVLLLCSIYEANVVLFFDLVVSEYKYLDTILHIEYREFNTQHTWNAYFRARADS